MTSLHISKMVLLHPHRLTLWNERSLACIGTRNGIKLSKPSSSWPIINYEIIKASPIILSSWIHGTSRNYMQCFQDIMKSPATSDNCKYRKPNTFAFLGMLSPLRLPTNYLMHNSETSALHWMVETKKQLK